LPGNLTGEEALEGRDARWLCAGDLMGGKAVVLWSGGKDSALAFREARLWGYDVVGLATFAPDGGDFLAHPLRFVRLQSEALAVPHVCVRIDQPFEASYEAAIEQIATRLEVATLVTGDVRPVDGYPNWIKERCRSVGVEVVTPLWGRDGGGLLEELLSCGFTAIFSCVKKAWFTEDWLGSRLDHRALEALRTISAESGLDICGEQGEYHTLVIDGPGFERGISIRAFDRRSTEYFSYLEISAAALAGKRRHSTAVRRETCL